MEMDWVILIKQLLNGFSLVLFLTLIALGLTVIFGVMRVVNMAHGELMMIGAYTAYGIAVAGYNFWLGLALAAFVTALIGIFMERSVIRFLYRRGDLSTLLATWGFSIIFQQIVKFIFGSQPQSVPSPFPGSVEFWGITYPAYRLFAIGMCLAVIVVVLLLFFRTHFGVSTRATIQNTETANIMGINTEAMFLFAFAFGAALAGLSGALIAPLIGVTPTMGLDFVAKAFFVVIVGGMGSLLGALGGGFVLGETESIFTVILNGTAAHIIVFIAVIILMLVKPKGLFSR